MKDVIAMIGEAWAITDEGFAAVQAAAESLAALDPATLAAAVDGKPPAAPSALSAERDDYLRGTRTASIRGNVGIIPIRGPLFSRGSWLTRYLGFGDYQTIAQDFRVALQSEDVGAIVLDVDSPGGMVAGVDELSGLIFQARTGAKPIIAYTGGMMASAAYWLGSAAREIIASPTALIGSIGVRMDVQDTKEADEKRGIRRRTIVSRQSPHKADDLDTEDGKERVQAIVDRLAAVFVGTVARNRATTADAVVDRYGKGGVLIAADAVGATMADKVATFEALISDVAKSTTPVPAGPFGLSAATGTSSKAKDGTSPMDETVKAADITADFIAANFPAIANHFRAEGAKAEGQRVAKIEALALPGHDDLVAKAKGDQTMTAEAFAVAQTEAAKARQAAGLSAFTADDKGFKAPAASDEMPGADGKGETEADVAAMVDRIIKAQ